MKNNQEEIDDLILQALNEEEAEFYHQLDEQSFTEMFFGLYKGKLKWLTILSTVYLFVFLGLAIYCLVKFLSVDDTRMLIKWGAGMFYCIMAVSMIKLFQWMQMDKNVLLREIKRLELQVTVLGNKISK